MKNTLTLLFICCIVLPLSSQIKYEPGYFIDNQNNRVDCLIKNRGWKGSPSEIKYKLTENSEEKTTNTKDFIELSIDNRVKYIGRSVQVDQSSTKLEYLSFTKEPEYKEKYILLKVLIEGEASLYEYDSNNQLRFFYNDGKSNAIEQLIYKEYKQKSGNIGKNRAFVQQLYRNIPCESIPLELATSLGYDRKSLLKYFIDYNQCKEVEFINFNEKSNKGKLFISARPRVTYASAKVLSDIEDGFFDANFGSTVSFGLGFEMEYVLPFYQGHWSLVMEPTLRSFVGSARDSVPSLTGNVISREFNYRSMEVPILIRYRMHLNDNSKLFFNAGPVLDINTRGSNYDNYLTNGILLRRFDLYSGINFVAGLGLDIKEKYTIEYRIFSNRELLEKNLGHGTDFQAMSLVFGYRIMDILDK